MDEIGSRGSLSFFGFFYALQIDIHDIIMSGPLFLSSLLC